MNEIAGQIGYFKLTDWWLSEFTPAEREYIESVYKPLSTTSNPRPLTQGTIQQHDGSVIQLFWGLAGWFKKTEDRHIARRILAKAEQFVTPEEDVIHRHFLYLVMIEVYYKDRDQSEFLEAAIRACQSQIDLAPEAFEAFEHRYPGASLPSHVGFKQLAIVREKQGDKAEAVRLCQMAKVQGWTGDWDKRIDRYSKT